MQPYHVALLRAQKAAKQTEEKAQRAADASLKQANIAQELASQAQGMQNQGLTVEASTLMTQAHATMQGAQDLKRWAEKLWNTANSLNGGIGYYQLSMGMAANTAAKTTLYNPPPDFPASPEEAAKTFKPL